MSEKTIIHSVFQSTIIAIVINAVMFGGGYIFLLKRLDTTPPIDERVTKNERDIGLVKEKIMGIKVDILELKADNKAQFSVILIKLEQIRTEAAQDRLRAARSESTIKNAQKHIDEKGLHEYRSYGK